MRRKAAAMVLVLGLFALAPAPLSACGMLMEVLEGCLSGQAPANAQHAEHCQAMAAESDSADFAMQSAGRLSCCDWAGAPVPEGKESASKLKLAPLAVAASLAVSHSPTPAAQRTEANAQPGVSPLDRQPLLCVFLI